MKNQKGITLLTLVVYVIVMIIVLTTLTAIRTQFYNNNEEIEEDTNNILQFNKFNTYFLKEVKLKDNAVDKIDENNKYILFKSGNSFLFNDNKIYYNNKEICNNVKELTIQQGRDGNGDKDVVCIVLKFENFEKKINYKIEEIY